MRVGLVHITTARTNARAAREETVDVERLTVGRGTSNALHIPGLAVGLEHCVIERSERGFQVRPVGRAALRVNRKYVTGATALESTAASSGCTRSPNEPPGSRASIRVVTPRERPVQDRRFIARDLLKESRAARWKVVVRNRHFDCQPIQIDHVEVGSHANLEAPAILHSVEACVPTRLLLDDELERQAFAARAPTA